MVTERINELKRLADQDGILVSPASEHSLLSFLAEHDVSATPALFLCDNGNFRALWSKGRQTHDFKQIGLEFLGGGPIRYVIISGDRSTSGEGMTTRVMGAISHLKVRSLIGLQVSSGSFGRIRTSDREKWQAELARDPEFTQTLADAFAQWLSERGITACDWDDIVCAAIILHNIGFWQRMPLEEFIKSAETKITVWAVHSLRQALNGD